MLTGIIYAPNPYVVARTLASRGLAVFPRSRQATPDAQRRLFRNE
jgi:hypothetical protein